MDSGKDARQLIERKIAHEIITEKALGEGRYGKVYRARFRGELVAVKKIHSREEKSWQREKEIYETYMLRHENILGWFLTEF